MFGVTHDRSDLSRRLVLAPRPRELLLRLWWREGKRRSVLLPHGWLFPGRSHTDPIPTRQLHRAVQEVAEAAGIRKREVAERLAGLRGRGIRGP